MKKIVSISICLVFILSASTVLLAPEKTKIKLTFGQFKEEVMANIMSRNEKLRTLFAEGEFDEMAKQFTRYSKIMKHDGEVIKARESGSYWREVREKMKKGGLKFEKPHFYGWELDLAKHPCPEETDFVVVEATKFSFVGASGGAIATLQRHKVRCIRD